MKLTFAATVLSAVMLLVLALRFFLPGVQADVTPTSTSTSTPTPTSTSTPTYEVGLTNPAPGANSDIQSNFLLPAPNYDFARLVAFTPPQFGVASGTDVPIGAVVARLTSTATLGLINDGCFSSAVIPFTFLNASVNPNDTIDPLPAGSEDRLKNIGGLLSNSDANGNGIPDGVDKYPSWLTRIFREDEDDPSSVITPRARLAADVYLQDIIGVQLSVILNFAIFEPGQTIDPPGPEPPMTFDPTLGYPSVTVLQTLGDPTERPSPSSITDFCTKRIALATVLGVTEDNPNTPANEGGHPHRTNPQAGSYNFVSYIVTQRDADLAGIENGLDPCPFSVNPNWDPRLPIGDASYAGDSDKDGIPDSCDEAQSQAGDSDTDLDGYVNRGDNCAQVQNGVNPVTLVVIGPNNQDDDDLDGIGNECDPNPQSADGARHAVCLSDDVS